MAASLSVKGTPNPRNVIASPLSCGCHAYDEQVYSIESETDDSDDPATSPELQETGQGSYLPEIVQDEVDKSLYKRLPKGTSSKLLQFSTNSKIFPSKDCIESDRQRLQERLKLYGLVEKEMKKDGNCQFRSLSDQLYRTPSHHKLVREQIVKHLKRNSEQFRGFISDDFDSYCKQMSKKGTWGDHVTLKAAADCFGIHMWLLTSYPDSSALEIDSKEVKSNRTLYLSFWAEVHYNSLYPEGEAIPDAHVNRLSTFGTRQMERLRSIGKRLYRKN